MKGLRKDVLEDLLFSYGEKVSSSAKGWKLCCPFHDDSNPSAIVFYESGVFSCFGCGAKKGPREGFAALGVPPEVLRGLFSGEPSLDPIKPLEALVERAPPTMVTGILTESPWNPKWNYRAIRGEFLTGPRLQTLFSPKLVRLILKDKKGIEHQERFSRLSLSYGSHRIFLRLSSEQEVRIYNSTGLKVSDPKLPFFGLTSMKLPPNLAGVFLVEGPYDLLRLTQNLNDIGVLDSFAVVALLGTGQWKAFLEKFDLRVLPWLGRVPFITAFDNDDAGRGVAKEAAADLGERGVPVLNFPYSASDPGDSPVEETRQGLLKLGF